MQKFIMMLACIIVMIMFVLQGFSPKYNLPSFQEQGQQANESDDAGPQQALTEIYFNVSIMGVADATPERLETDFGIDSSHYLGVWGRYTDGRFGAADVIIIQPRYGMEQEVREDLQTIKLARMSLFKNYDIYNSYSLAENGTIIERGDYIILLMIDNKETVTEILNSYISR